MSANVAYNDTDLQPPVLIYSLKVKYFTTITVTKWMRSAQQWIMLDAAWNNFYQSQLFNVQQLEWDNEQNYTT